MSTRQGKSPSAAVGGIALDATQLALYLGYEGPVCCLQKQHRILVKFEVQVMNYLFHFIHYHYQQLGAQCHSYVFEWHVRMGYVCMYVCMYYVLWPQYVMRALRL